MDQAQISVSDDPLERMISATSAFDRFRYIESRDREYLTSGREWVDREYLLPILCLELR